MPTPAIFVPLEFGADADKDPARWNRLGRSSEYPRMAPMMDPKVLPFDGKRMFWGGFKTIIEI
jgi:uncharacterized protein YbaA (DUF1428 family)